jgi:hypothetical protein
MALPRQEQPIETVVELRGRQTLGEDLGAFGRWVGPRFDELTGSRARERGRLGEHWCLRRLLVGMACADRLEFPATLRMCAANGTQGRRLPDAVLSQPGARDVGIELTEATSERWQKRLYAMDKAAAETGTTVVSDAGDGQAGDAPERQAVREIEEAHRRKVAKLAAGTYAQVREVDLLIYLNSEAGIHVDPADVVERVTLDGAGQQGEARFRKVHVLFDDVVALDLLGDRALIPLQSRYEHDFRQWCADQAERLRTGDVAGLDLRNLAEELRSLGGSDERGRDSQIRRLLQHLLKWQYQPEKRSTSWAVSIANARIEIEELVDYSPSLGRTDELRKAVEKEYPRAVRLASRETGLKRSAFPGHCPYALNQIFDPDYPDDLVNED